MKVKYFATYNGPNYTSYDTEYREGFESVKQAMQAMRNRKYGSDYINEYRENKDGSMVPWSTDCYSVFFNTNADYMDLVEAYSQADGTWSYSEDIAYRLTIGERGGIVVERN